MESPGKNHLMETSMHPSSLIHGTVIPHHGAVGSPEAVTAQNFLFCNKCEHLQLVPTWFPNWFYAGAKFLT